MRQTPHGYHTFAGEAPKAERVCQTVTRFKIPMQRQVGKKEVGIPVALVVFFFWFFLRFVCFEACWGFFFSQFISSVLILVALFPRLLVRSFCFVSYVFLLWLMVVFL